MKPNLTLNFSHYPDNKRFTLNLIFPRLKVSIKNLNQIAKICNQPQIYNRFFKTRLLGLPYTTKHARDFISLSTQGYLSNKQFAFLIKDDHKNIIGQIDLKILSKSKGQIGYWQSEATTGTMTNALLTIIKLAKALKLKSLLATPAADNQKSQKLLLRAGFIYRHSQYYLGKKFFTFTKSLRSLPLKSLDHRDYLFLNLLPVTFRFLNLSKN